jgi:hypothetical protein
MSVYEIEVPGTFLEGVAFLDLETVKVPTPDGFRMQNGEVLKRRWSIALAGVARDGIIEIIDSEGEEAYGLGQLGDSLRDATAVVYCATRQFDEMICRGRFTNARRAHLLRPEFPAVPGAEDLTWLNIARPEAPIWRGKDVASRDVPNALVDGRRRAVLVHLLRDVVELIVMGGSPSSGCQAWCTGVLVDYQSACDALEI